MPELPEVETIVQQLSQKVKGKTIVKAEILDTRVVDSKIQKILPVKIIGLRRRAKYIIIELENKQFLLVHLAMTGHFHYVPAGKKIGAEDEKFMVARFDLDDGSILTHNSIRKFGSIKLLQKKELEKKLAELGPEPLAADFTLEKLKEIFSRKKKANLKTALMDQKFLAGVGNIYAQEILYHAGIDPRRKIESLARAEIERLYQELRRVLQLAITHHGSTVDNYAHMEGSGGFQKYLVVYGRDKCPHGHPLEKINQGGRGTSYCPRCQK